MSIFDLPGIWSGKMSPAHLVREHRREKTSASFSKKSQGSGSRMPLFLNLMGGGSQQDVSWDETGAQLGEFMMRSGGEFRSAENGFVSYAISMGTQPQRYYLTLNCSEKPRVPIITKLSKILEDNPDSRYNLSARACQGILNRASRRGKELPEELKEALERQATK